MHMHESEKRKILLRINMHRKLHNLCMKTNNTKKYEFYSQKMQKRG